MSVSSAEFASIQAAAAEHQIAVSLGFTERDGDSVYIAQAMISATGEVATKRRKMKPTHMERTIFGDATGGQCLAPLVQVPEVGNVGNLSCWEHIQPLLKFYTFSQGEQIHVAAWPPLDTFVDGSPGFYSMTDEGCLTASRAYAMESQTFVLHCTTVLTQPGLELLGTVGSPLMGKPSDGKSALVGPDGRVLATTKTSGEELLIADLDMSLITKTRTFADAAGHCKNVVASVCTQKANEYASQTADPTCFGLERTTRTRELCGWQTERHSMLAGYTPVRVVIPHLSFHLG